MIEQIKNIDVDSIMNFVVRQDCNVNRKEIKQMLAFPVRESMINVSSI